MVACSTSCGLTPMRMASRRSVTGWRRTTTSTPCTSSATATRGPCNWAPRCWTPTACPSALATSWGGRSLSRAMETCCCMAATWPPTTPADNSFLTCPCSQAPTWRRAKTSRVPRPWVATGCWSKRSGMSSPPWPWVRACSRNGRVCWPRWSSTPPRTTTTPAWARASTSRNSTPAKAPMARCRCAKPSSQRTTRQVWTRSRSASQARRALMANTPSP